MHVEDRPGERPRISAFLLASIVVLLAGLVAIGSFIAPGSRSSALASTVSAAQGADQMDPGFLERGSSAVLRRPFRGSSTTFSAGRASSIAVDPP